MGIFLLILGLVLFIALVVIHELGHFWAARRAGVDVEEFGIFFPPRLYKKRMKGGWDFTINLIPLGGFVKLKGEHDSDTAKGSFGAASLKDKSKITAAGVVMNLITAFVLFTLLALVGMPHIVDNQFTVASDTTYQRKATFKNTVSEVEAGSPAAKAGIGRGDVINSIASEGDVHTLSAQQSLSDLTKQYAGKTVSIRYTHDGKQYEKQVTLRSDAEVATAAKQGKNVGRLGVGSDPTQDGLTIARSTWSAPVVAGGVMGQFTVLTFQGLGKALVGLFGTIAGGLTGNTSARQTAQTQASNQVSGPVGIYFVLKYGAELGIKFILMVIALISLTLAIMNILPIPALDGGRLWITLFAHAIKRPLSARREELINASGFVFLMTLIALVTFVDIKRFF
jgi:regulator of sigma E protease